MTKRLLAAMLTLVLGMSLFSGRAKAEFSGKNQINGAVLDGNKAVVSYSAEEDAELVAGVYSEDGKELLTSGTSRVPAAEKGTTKIWLSGELPEYAVVRLFLLTRKEHAPLCPVYTTSRYTRVPEDIRDIDADRFDPQNVLNIGENSFAVIKQGVTLVRYAEGKNQLLSQDDDALKDTIGSAGEAVQDLRAGQSLILEYEKNRFRMVRVRKTERSDETTVILSGDDALELTELFDVLKVDEEAESGAFRREKDGLTEKDGMLLLKEDNLDGEVTFAPALKFRMYGTTEQQLRLEAELTTSGTLTTTKAVDTEIPLGVYEASPVDGVTFRTAPVLKIRTEGAQTVHWTMKETVGFVYHSASNRFEDLSGDPEIFLTADESGKISLAMETDLEASLWTDVIRLGMKANLGGVSEITHPEGHRCRSGTLSAEARTEGVAELLAMPWKTHSADLVQKTTEKKFYWMPDTQEWDWGDCDEKVELLPDEPATPEKPDVPETPDESKEPEQPAEPETPSVPDASETPDTPSAPEQPSQPDEPAPPQTPDESEPDKPETIKYRLEEGTLCIETEEQMAAHTSAEETPWYAERETIRRVEVSEEIHKIGSYAFAGCENLEEVIFKAEELEIGKSAFADCGALTTVIYPGKKTQWKSLFIGEGNEALAHARVTCSNGDIKPK